MSKYEVWAWGQFKGRYIYTKRYSVNTPFEAARLIWSLSMIDLQNSLVVSNVMGLEVYEDNDWTEWYSKFGEDIRDFSDSLNIGGSF